MALTETEQAIPVTTFTMKDFGAARIGSPKNLAGIVPGLIIPDYGSSMTSTIYMRGIGSRMEILSSDFTSTIFLSLTRIIMIFVPGYPTGRHFQGTAGNVVRTEFNAGCPFCRDVVSGSVAGCPRCCRVWKCQLVEGQCFHI